MSSVFFIIHRIICSSENSFKIIGAFCKYASYTAGHRRKIRNIIYSQPGVLGHGIVVGQGGADVRADESGFLLVIVGSVDVVLSA